MDGHQEEVLYGYIEYPSKLRIVKNTFAPLLFTNLYTTALVGKSTYLPTSWFASVPVTATTRFGTANGETASVG